MKEFQALDHIRGDELIEWGNYIDNGGQIFPMGAFGLEQDSIPSPSINHSFSFPSSITDRPEHQLAQLITLSKEGVNLKEISLFLGKRSDVTLWINKPLNEIRDTILSLTVQFCNKPELIKLLLDNGASVLSPETKQGGNLFHQYTETGNDNV